MEKRIYVSTRGPDDWRRLLADPVRHWKPGYSARALAECWEAANGWPPEVAAVLHSSPEPTLTDIELLIAIPEFRVSLPPRGKPSQNDLFVLAKATDGQLVAITVEGKVDESFGPTLAKWNIPVAPGKTTRLQYLTRTLGLPDELPPDIRYQLLHRAASALILAMRFNARHALMFVHSFSPTRSWFDDYQSFVRLFSSQDARPDQLHLLGEIDGIKLHAGWVLGNTQYVKDQTMFALPHEEPIQEEQIRRREALQQLEELADRIHARNADLTPEEVEQLADEISRETIQRMIDQGKVTFQA